ncbi:thioesterase II family protein [Spirosoma endbachense]|uniref:Alpha/beta fold hydrolase n=1 Tax=Spirosoma endbachense TaxID=2666025 RepID=A0A6P1VSK1_9BACT|nr:alpha/beta fold hydrolase [Spirosoma endbachense]QHV96211.1 alpha/beta fold hydrolase [Spirosoma endbachense]
MEALRLFCFPFAAGSCYSYQPLIRQAPPGIVWIPLDYPGRGRRLFESSLDTLDAVADDLFRRLKTQLTGPFAFFGHSMGSLIAYRLSCRLRAEGMTPPLHLFLSGRGGASIPEKQRNAKNMTRQEIIQEVQDMDGDVSALLKNPRSFDLYEKVLRADMMALESYDYAQTGPASLTIPATVFIGENDIYTLAEAARWQEEFTAPIDLHILPGGHFFLFDNAPFIHRCVHDALVPFSLYPMQRHETLSP